MTQQRLSHVCILNAYPRRADNLGTERLMKLFVNNDCRRQVFGDVGL